MTPGRALALLADAFAGDLSPDTNWMDLLEAANRALVTPRLERTLTSSGATVPADAAEFMALISARNRERNRRLRGLARDAVEALNAHDITPVYLKGMAVWAACDAGGEDYPRMMSDVDLLVRPQEGDRAIEALVARGFDLRRRYPSHSPHIVAEFSRNDDVGTLDLHHRPPGPEGLAGIFDVDVHTAPAPWTGAARLPHPAMQVYLTCLHDLFHDGAFWRGGFDVRHLCDIADLAHASPGVAWQVLDGLARTRLSRNAILSELVAARRIVAAPVPDTALEPMAPRLHYRRRRAQIDHPSLSFALALLGIALEAPNLSQHWPFIQAERHGPEDEAGRGGLAYLLGRLRRPRNYPNRL